MHRSHNLRLNYSLLHHHIAPTFFASYLTTFLLPRPSFLPSLPLPSLPQMLPIYLEFIQHHILMGASHIFLSAPFAWGGKIMTSLLRILRSFIEEGSLSLNSQADNGEDFLYGIHGLSIDKDTMRIIQVSGFYRSLILFFCPIGLTVHTSMYHSY